MSVTMTTEELLIGGKRVPAADGRTYETLNPATGEVIAQVAEAGVEDVNRAVAAARAAFDEGPWPTWPAWRRERVMHKVAAIIADRTKELATLESQNCGKTIRNATGEVKGISLCFQYYAGWATKLSGETSPPEQGWTTHCGSRLASLARSSPGTSRSSWRPGSWLRRSPPGAVSCSSRRNRRH